MVSKLLSLFLAVFFIFSTISVEEVRSIDRNDEHSTSMMDNAKNLLVSVFEKTHGDDCPDCADKGHACQGFCHCMTSFFIESQKNISFSNILILVKTRWYSYSNYHPPFLDLASKPPLFS